MSGVLHRAVYYLLSALTFLLGPVVNFVFRLIYGGRGPSVTRVTEPLLLQSATALAKQIRSRQVRAEVVMQAFIARAKEVNPVVNAIVAERYEAALAEAREVDRQLDQNPGAKELSEGRQPLLGVPLTVKEAFAVKGMPNTSGLISRRQQVSERDAETTHRLRAAGMIPFAVTNTSELCMWYESSNNLYGTTRNAYDTNRIVGGSSGGEGCIISAGASVLGIGSDIGGSIRMPAFFNGVFGHKPSKDVVPNDGQFPPATGGQVELLATGPMCRYAEDLIPALKVMAGPNATKLTLDAKVDMGEVRVFCMEDDGGSLLVSRMDPQLRDAQRRAVAHLVGLGAKVEGMHLPLMKYSLEMWSAKMAAGQGKAFNCFMAGGEEGKSVNCFLEIFRWLARQSDHTLPAVGLGMMEVFTSPSHPSVTRLLDLLSTLHRQLTTLLGNDGVLLYPSHPTSAPYHNQPITTPFNFAYTAIFNALGLPVTQVPLGLSAEGLPMGLQVVASPFHDHLTIATATALQEGLGGWVSPGATGGQGGKAKSQ